MRGRIAAITAATLLAISGGLTEAGEIVLKNGTRVPADLVSQALLVSTGTDLVEVQPEQVAVLAADEIRTRDGRTIRGSLVGGTIRARTTYGELTVALDDLVEFRADAPAAAAAPSLPSPSPIVEPPRAAAAAPPSLPSPPPSPSPIVERPQAAAAAPSLPSPPPGVEQPQAVAAPSAPVQPAREREPIRRGAWDKTMDFARSVTDGVDRIHDGFVTAGRTIRDGMFEAARAIRRTFTD